MHMGRIPALGKGEGICTIEREVLEAVHFLHAQHLVLFVQAYYVLPLRYLLVTPLHAVDFCHLNLCSVFRCYPKIVPDSIILVSGLRPCKIYGSFSSVSIFSGCNAVGHLNGCLHECVALVLPLRYHHSLQLILTVHEVGLHGAPHRYCVIYLQCVAIVLWYDVQIAACAEKQVGRCTYIDIALCTYIRIRRTC